MDLVPDGFSKFVGLHNAIAPSVLFYPVRKVLSVIVVIGSLACDHRLTSVWVQLPHVTMLRTCPSDPGCGTGRKTPTLNLESNPV